MKKKHKWKYQINIKKKILVLIILGVSLFVGLGYALIESNLNIFGTLDVARYDKTLYGVLRKEVNKGYAIEYTDPHQDSMDPTKSTEKVYNFYADTTAKSSAIQEKYNVVFAGYCWQMTRTTDTGGVRLLYNGEPETTLVDGTVQYNCGDTRNLYNMGENKTQINLNGTYLYSDSYTSTTNGTTTTFTLTNPKSITVNSSNATTKIAEIISSYPYTCRNTSGTCNNQRLYRVNSQDSSTTVNAYISAYRNITGNDVYNDNYRSLTGVGYKYGDYYRQQSTGIRPDENLQTSQYIRTNNRSIMSWHYADPADVDWNNLNANNYTFVNSKVIDSETDFSMLAGKYVMETTVSPTVYYVISGSNPNANLKALSNGSFDTSISFAENIVDNGNGTYSLATPIQTIDLKDWYTGSHSSAKNKYTCGDSNTTCATPRYITYTTSDYYSKLEGFITIAKSRNGLNLVDYATIDLGTWNREGTTTYKDYKYTCGNTDTVCTESDLRLINAKYPTSYNYYVNHYYGSSVIYENGKYKLQNITEIETPTNMNVFNTHHYTCLNLGEKECSSVAYINTFYSGHTIFYIILNDPNVTSISEAIKGMFEKNTNDSTVKKSIDAWYAARLSNTAYETKIDDTIFCNDRTITNYAGYREDGNLTQTLNFKERTPTKDLYCNNITDSFSVSNPEAKLTYPVGILSTPELNILGIDNVRIPVTTTYWTLSPNSMEITGALQNYVYGNGSLSDRNVIGERGTRPSISLIKDTEYYRGVGSTTNPYVVKPSDGWNIATSINPFNNQKFEYWENGSKIMSGWRDLTDISGRPNTYYFEDGYSYHGWLELDGNKYYLSTFDDDGNGVVDGRRFNSETRTIDGVEYTFDENGVCTNCN